MKKKKNRLSALVLTTAMGFAFSAQAALVPRTVGSDQMVYDTDLDITWLANANQGAGSSFDDGANSTDGLMTWNNALAWADNLVYGGKDDWRLPTIGPVNGSTYQTGFSNDGSTDVGYGNTSPASQLAYMYYVNLGNLGLCTPNGGGSSSGCIPQSGAGLNNAGPFTNLQPLTYWSGTEGDPGFSAWHFNFANGVQGRNQITNEKLAWAVRTGDVAAVPLPSAVWLFSGALAGLAAFGRQKSRAAASQ